MLWQQSLSRLLCDSADVNRTEEMKGWQSGGVGEEEGWEGERSKHKEPTVCVNQAVEGESENSYRMLMGS